MDSKREYTSREYALVQHIAGRSRTSAAPVNSVGPFSGCCARSARCSEVHRVGPNCANWPSVLTENPYRRPELGPRFGPALRNLCYVVFPQSRHYLAYEDRVVGEGHFTHSALFKWGSQEIKRMAESGAETDMPALQAVCGRAAWGRIDTCRYSRSKAAASTGAGAVGTGWYSIAYHAITQAWAAVGAAKGIYGGRSTV